jgi:hypothetical protein
MTLERSKGFLAGEVRAAQEARREGCPTPHQVGQQFRTIELRHPVL